MRCLILVLLFCPSLLCQTHTICIDPGHGGTDPGAIGFGKKEKDFNLDMALHFKAALEADTKDPKGGGAWKVLMTRETDTTMSLASRVAYANANNADRFLSLHCNAFSNPAAHGVESYAYQNKTTAADLRDSVQAEAIEHWGLYDRGNKIANFYVLVHTTMPAELHECGFITNAGDFAVMDDPQMRKEAGRYHMHGLQNHYGYPDYDPKVGGTLKGIVYDAPQGATKPIQGAFVILNTGQNKQTGANGYFEFNLPSGHYQIAAYAPDYKAGWSSETVTTGDVWESLGLYPGGSAYDLGVSHAQPAIGTTVTFTLSGNPGPSAHLLFGLKPLIPPLDLGFSGFLGLDLTSPWNVLSSGTIPFVFNLMVPPNPAYVGIPVFYQGYVEASPWALTNTVATTFQ